MPSGVGDVPRRPLSFGFTRRDLFRSPVTRARRGPPAGPAYSLATLGTLPDGDLARIRPVLIDGCRLSVSDGVVCGWTPGDEAPRRLFAAEPACLVALDAIDGRTNLGAIAERVLRETGSPGAFPYVRAVFLRLVMAHLARPE